MTSPVLEPVYLPDSAFQPVPDAEREKWLTAWRNALIWWTVLLFVVTLWVMSYAMQLQADLARLHSTI